MYKLAKYLMAYAAKKEREKLKAEMFYFLGWQPEKMYNEELQAHESEEHYQKRLDAWFGARKLVGEFFEEVAQDRQKK